MLTLASDAQQRISDDLGEAKVCYPTARFVLPGQPGVSRYALPALVRLLRVYLQVPNVSQQILPQTDITTFEGDDLLIFDATSGSLVLGMGSMQMSPQWIAEQPQTYPVLNDAGDRGAYSALYSPYQSVIANPNQRPEVAIDGGTIIIVPPPSNPVYNVLLDFVPLPIDFIQDSDYAMWPQQFRNAMVYDTIVRMYLADRRTNQAAAWDAKYQQSFGAALTSIRSMPGSAAQRLTILTMRSLIDWDLSC